MVEETLALGREEAATQTAKFRIGEFELCEPDYRQVLIWAKVLNGTPEQVIQGLLYPWKENWAPEWSEPRLADGRLLNINWNFNVVPTRYFEWVDELVITHLTFPPLDLDTKGLELCLRLRSLSHLSCGGLNAAKIDLSGVPMLMELLCDQNSLTKLELSSLPLLRKLDCSWNALADLSLPCSNLTELVCVNTLLTKLDLSNVPNLTRLGCDINQITQLNLAHVPNLTELSCIENKLTELDLSHVPNLTELCCGRNYLTELDIRPLLSLKTLKYDSSSTRLVKRPDQNF